MSDQGPEAQRPLRGGAPAMGERSQRLPESLRDAYFVESEDEVLDLIAKDPGLVERASDLICRLQTDFGPNAHLVLGTLWSLNEPIEPNLAILVRTRLDLAEAERPHGTVEDRDRLDGAGSPCPTVS